MTKTMYDSINPLNIPTDAQMVAGYVNGHVSQWPKDEWGRWPREREVHIDVIGNYAFDADVLDVESGAAGLAQIKPWILQRVKYGRAAIYFSRSNLGKVAAEVIGLHGVDVWIADWTGEPHRVSVPGNMNLVAVQYKNEPDFDLSVVYDAHWPWKP